MVSKDFLIIATTEIRGHESPEGSVSCHVTFPQELERAEIVTLGESVIWGIDREAEEAVLSRGEDWIEEQEFEESNPSTIDASRISKVPNRLVAIHDLPDGGDRVFFVAEDRKLINEACRVVPRLQSSTIPTTSSAVSRQNTTKKKPSGGKLSEFNVTQPNDHFSGG